MIVFIGEGVLGLDLVKALDLLIRTVSIYHSYPKAVFLLEFFKVVDLLKFLVHADD